MSGWKIKITTNKCQSDGNAYNIFTLKLQFGKMMFRIMIFHLWCCNYFMHKSVHERKTKLHFCSGFLYISVLLITLSSKVIYLCNEIWLVILYLLLLAVNAIKNLFWFRTNICFKEQYTQAAIRLITNSLALVYRKTKISRRQFRGYWIHWTTWNAVLKQYASRYSYRIQLNHEIKEWLNIWDN